MLANYSISKERVFGFTDAVFSIAITLLVLEIEVPSFTELKEKGASDALIRLIPSFIGFLVSFLVIALYWKLYLYYTKYIERFDNKLYWYNIFMLLSIVLLPFSTDFFVESVFLRGPFTFYCGNLVMLSLFMYLMMRVVFKRAKLKVAAIDAKWIQFKALSGVIFWTVALILSLYFTVFSRFFIFFIFIFQGIGRIHFRRKAKRL